MEGDLIGMKESNLLT